MSTDREDFDLYRDEPVEEKKGFGCMKGCLIALLVLLVIVLLAAYWISQNWRDWAASAATTVSEQAINDSALPEEEKVELKEEVSRLTEAFKAGEVSSEEMVQIFELFAQSPLMASMIVSQVEAQYLNQSGLTEEEKLEGKVALNRYIRGLFNEQIPQQSLDEVLDPIADKQADGSWQLRQSVTDEQLRTMFAVAEEKADEAEIPDQVEQPDPSEELSRIIDEAIGKQQTPPDE